jgi:hypothetical protein
VPAGQHQRVPARDREGVRDCEGACGLSARRVCAGLQKGQGGKRRDYEDRQFSFKLESMTAAEDPKS